MQVLEDVHMQLTKLEDVLMNAFTMLSQYLKQVESFFNSLYFPIPQRF